MSYNSIPIGKHAPEILNAIVEIPKGGHNKYEYDSELDEIKLDRVLYSPLFFPVDYGFIPETKSEDGDHADVLIITDSPTFSGCILEVRPIGILKMTDEKGLDDKILAVPFSNHHYEKIKDINDIESHVLDAIIHFFEEYKKLEKKSVKVKGWGSLENAMSFIRRAQAKFEKEKGKNCL